MPSTGFASQKKGVDQVHMFQTGGPGKSEHKKLLEERNKQNPAIEQLGGGKMEEAEKLPKD